MKGQPFDRSVLKVNQVILMVTLVGAYIAAFRFPLTIVALPVLAAMMLAATASPATNLPRIVYARWLKPAGVVRPRLVDEDPAPHRFAQGVGGAFLVAASAFGLTGLTAVAWVLAWIVVVLAFLNFAFDICVGCIVYARLVRVGVVRRRPSPAA